jgi:hypothetical protein
MGGPKQHSLGGSATGSTKTKAPKGVHLYLLSFASLAVISTLAGYQTSRFHDGGQCDLVQAASPSSVRATAPGGAAETKLAGPSRSASQQQAQYLLDRAIGRDTQSLELIAKNVDGWRGQLQNTDRLFDLVRTALNSDNLRVRAAAVEIDLAANNLSKSPETVSRLVERLRDDPADRPWTLWRLGALGNRGVQPAVVLVQLLAYVRDRNEETRYWAVEGLAVLGTNAAIDPLLDRFAHDPSSRVRQRAACNLAQAGLLTKEQRLTAVPQLLNFFDDDALDSATRGWVYGALRLITGAQLGNDAGAWRQWWAKRDTTHKQVHHRTAILFA